MKVPIFKLSFARRMNKKINKVGHPNFESIFFSRESMGKLVQKWEFLFLNASVVVCDYI